MFYWSWHCKTPVGETLNLCVCLKYKSVCWPLWLLYGHDLSFSKGPCEPLVLAIGQLLMTMHRTQAQIISLIKTRQIRLATLAPSIIWVFKNCVVGFTSVYIYSFHMTTIRTVVNMREGNLQTKVIETWLLWHGYQLSSRATRENTRNIC